MEQSDNKCRESRNGWSRISEEIQAGLSLWSENITNIDLSYKRIKSFHNNITLPSKLEVLNLSYNNLNDVPSAVLNLKQLKSLDLSYNKIQYFNERPEFCETICELNLSNNNLKGPPYWVWSATPKNLHFMNLSDNIDLTQSFESGYFEKLLENRTLVTKLILFNCRISKYKQMIGTFQKATFMELGRADYGRMSSNSFDTIPFEGLDLCCHIERLVLSNVQIYTISPNIDMFKSLVDIDLSQNNISHLPDEFYNLVNLETCVLSSNSILYLSNDIVKLQGLMELYLDSNVLCMLPENINELTKLQLLDLYDNHLHEVPDISNIEEADLAQNYFAEPDDDLYLEKRSKIRMDKLDRFDGRKIVTEPPERKLSSSTIDDDLDIDWSTLSQSNKDTRVDTPSSVEDWESDEYWVPHFSFFPSPPRESAWLHFVKKKIAEGSFCPIDLHPVPVEEKVKYEKICKPQELYESDGQFDDLSDNDS